MTYPRRRGKWSNKGQDTVLEFAPRILAARGITAAGSLFTASMMRDIEAGLQIEADHVIGDLLRRVALDTKSGDRNV
jgi:ketopantoate reductase